MIIPTALAPVPYLPEELHDVAERHAALLDRERAARAEVQRARQAVPVAEAEDKRRQVDSIRNGGTARDAGWDCRDAALADLADAEAELDATLALIRATRSEWVAGVREHLAEVLDRAEHEAEKLADEYKHAITELFGRRRPYVTAAGWVHALRRFERDGDTDALRWPGEVAGDVIRYRGESVRGNEIAAAYLPAVFEADSTRHVPPAPRKPTADDRRLSQDFARATGAKLLPVAEKIA